MNVEDWSYNDFKAYLFIYCSFADHLEVDKERSLAIEKIGKEKYYQIHKLIEEDTDDIGINKIRKYIKINKIAEEKLNDLLWDITEMFLSDGVFHKLEKRLYKSLERIFDKVYSNPKL